MLLALAACSPDIPSGSYECGPNAACPTGQACDGPTNTCVIASTAGAFACDPGLEHDDNTPATGTRVSQLACVSAVFSEPGCLAPNDGQDWFQLAAPTGCAALEVKITVAYPVAFEPLALALTDASGAQLATDSACKNPPPGGEDSRCITQTITPGSSYAIAVKPLGMGDDCDGTCNFNRYTLSVQLDTP
ncbi:MAG TPA: hypothetical protein VFQ65_25215 [Kofleriaceae bacterium]|nr:hypothetical protein [Kofleriaceae bacterium]